MKIIVIGAGTAGLAALHTLAARGAHVLCLEAAPLPGGRTTSRLQDGYIFDLGTQFFFSHYDTYNRLAYDAGLMDDLESWPFIAGFWHHERFNPLIASVNPRDLWAWRRYLKGVHRCLPWRAYLQLLPLLPTLIRRLNSLEFTRFEGILDLDRESLADFITRKGGCEALEYVFQPVASCLTLGQPEEIGAGYGLALLWNMINGLWTFRHGIGALSARLGEMHSSSIHYNTPARKIVIDQGRVRGVETEAGLIEADAVICTTTAQTALKIAPALPDTLRKPLGMARYTACCHVQFALQERLFPKDWYAAAMPRKAGSFVVGFLDDSSKGAAYVPEGGGLVNCFTFGPRVAELIALPDHEVEHLVIKEIRRYMPAMPDKPLFSVISRFDEAVCTSPPGMLETMQHLRAHNYHAVHGLFLAGDYLLMPSVEGSAASGCFAAAQALR